MSKEAWHKFLNGDRSSFSELYFTYFNELLAYGLKIGFDEDTCKDAIQDLFFKIYLSGSRLKHIRHIEFYLLQTLRHTLFDMHNRETRLQQINPRELQPNEEESTIDLLIHEENLDEQRQEILNLLTILSPRQRKIIRYRYHLNLNDAEIATLMGMSPDTVKKNIYRALRKMREASSRK
ncbi:MAG: RNA polymerase sigma factor [Proteiniphilum sp.]|nr:RNA polymerase sigma factor [Proteiniphilum sp.]